MADLAKLAVPATSFIGSGHSFTAVGSGQGVVKDDEQSPPLSTTPLDAKSAADKKK